MPIIVPKLSYIQIQQHATAFLLKNNPAGTIPVPIEKIIDLQMGINIIPVPGLVDFGIDAYTWSDMQNIVVDRFFYDKQNRRYRFTLAHEIGHIVLHHAILETAQIDSLDAYTKFMGSITEDDHRWTEWQANCFAGLVLVPAEPLARKLQEANEKAKANGLVCDDIPARGYISDWISDYFEVSARAIEVRLVYCGLWPRIEKKDKRVPNS